MRRFAELYYALDATTRTSEKVAALRAYFDESPLEDAAWGLRLLTGGRFKRTVSYPNLRRWAAEAASLPEWLIAECHEAVGDFSETIALVLPEPEEPEIPALAELVRTVLEPMRRMDEREQRAALEGIWRTMDGRHRLVFHKLLSGSFRVGAGRKLVIRALAAHAGVEPAVMEHRLSGSWEVSADGVRALCAAESEGGDPARPYPFFLASPVEGDAAAVEAALGPPSEWMCEWKWDGIRAQLIRREAEPVLWSRGEDMIGRAFPELIDAARGLPIGTVLDGEVLAWRGAPGEGDGVPLPFNALQRRLNRVDYQPTLFDDVPVRFLAYDLLEAAGADLREAPIEDRRGQLESLVGSLPNDTPVAVSEAFTVCHWSRGEAMKDSARERGVEGLMLKRRGSPYRTGRTRGDWFKWKVDPLTADCVLIAAQPGSGRRASLFTDYTFGVWDGERPGAGELVPIAKAYSGLTDQEIKRVDHFVRTHITGRHGPVRTVEPKLVFEIGFEGIAASSRHKSGIALRFPRMLRWRHDKQAHEADTLATMRSLLEWSERSIRTRGST
ncbi:MAG: ATP-dependent DNA ligase [Planctomycetota bacterium]